MFEKIIDAILNERTIQDKQYGELNKLNTSKDWLPILTEEVGEVAKAIQDKDLDNLKIELIQTSAVCIQWLEKIYQDESAK